MSIRRRGIHVESWSTKKMSCSGGMERKTNCVSVRWSCRACAKRMWNLPCHARGKGETTWCTRSVPVCEGNETGNENMCEGSYHRGFRRNNGLGRGTRCICRRCGRAIADQVLRRRRAFRRRLRKWLVSVVRLRQTNTPIPKSGWMNAMRSVDGVIPSASHSVSVE